MTSRCVAKMIYLGLYTTLFCAFFLATQAGAGTEIPLEKQGGVYRLPVRINGVITLKFILDSGASEVTIPADVALTLIRTGTIADSDFLPGMSYKLADGSELKSARLIVREMEFGGIKINNVPCSVTPSAGDLLLGQSLLEKLNSWTLDNNKHVLLLDSAAGGLRPNSSKIIPPSPKRNAVDQPQAVVSFDDASSAYRNGDYATAYKAFKVLAEQGEPRAQFLLGFMCAEGEGVSQNYVQAAKWYRKAAEQGFAEAQYLLGDMYNKGQGVPKDSAEAVDWFRRAAEKGFAGAQFCLGYMYALGQGTPEDLVQAHKWLNLAAKQENADAQWMLGTLYSNGQGVRRDYILALDWFRKAANQSHEKAQFNLGLIYEDGKGVSQDFVQAHMWYDLAAAQGDSFAKQKRDRVAKQMTPSQIKEAQRLAREWKPKAQKR